MLRPNTSHAHLRSYTSPSPCQNRLFASDTAPSTSSNPSSNPIQQRHPSVRICSSRTQITTNGTVQIVKTIVSRTISIEQHAEQLERSAWRHGRVRHVHDKSTHNTKRKRSSGLTVKFVPKQVFWRLSGPAATRPAGVRSARLQSEHGQSALWPTEL